MAFCARDESSQLELEAILAPEQEVPVAREGFAGRGSRKDHVQEAIHASTPTAVRTVEVEKGAPSLPEKAIKAQTEKGKEMEEKASRPNEMRRRHVLFTSKDIANMEKSAS